MDGSKPYFQVHGVAVSTGFSGVSQEFRVSGFRVPKP